MYIETTQPKKLANDVKKRRRMRVVIFFFLLFVAWAGIQWMEMRGKVLDRVDKLAQLEVKLEQTKSLNEHFQHEIIRMNDPEYIEQLLRKDLHLTKDGEKLFIQTR